MSRSQVPHFTIRVHEAGGPISFFAIPITSVPGHDSTDPEDLLNTDTTVHVNEDTVVFGRLISLSESYEEAINKILDLPDLDSSSSSSSSSEDDLSKLVEAHSKKFQNMERTIKALLTTVDSLQAKMNVMENVMNKCDDFDEVIIPNVNLTMRSSHLKNALELPDPVKCIEYIMIESTELKALQGIKWSEISDDEQDLLMKLFSFIVAERYEISTGTKCDPTTTQKLARGLKTAYQKKVTNSLRPACQKSGTPRPSQIKKAKMDSFIDPIGLKEKSQVHENKEPKMEISDDEEFVDCVDENDYEPPPTPRRGHGKRGKSKLSVLSSIKYDAVKSSPLRIVASKSVDKPVQNIEKTPIRAKRTRV